MTAAVRSVARVIRGQAQMEGAGVKIVRTLGNGGLRMDPFLMLDELRMPANEATAGFPSHPHRGFETCSIVLTGEIEHEDSVGNRGVIGPGDVQWMTAGRGIVHSEMPKSRDGELHGFQLWVNLPAKDKMVKPWYQDVRASAFPTVGEAGAEVRVLAGEVDDAKGPIKLRNPGTLLHVQLQPGSSWRHALPREWNGFVYVYEGSGLVGDERAKAQHAYLFAKDGSDVVFRADENHPLKFLLAFGKPINEPIVQYGPFVMNTEAEIQQAFSDYRSGHFQNPKDDVWAEA